MGRDTKTGKVAEDMLIPTLKRGGYSITPQFNVGPKLNGRKHIIDYLLEKDGRKILISKKWQQSDGTAEEKVPYEIICLLNACKTIGCFAYLVLGGTDANAKTRETGWTLRKFYVEGGLRDYIQYTDFVKVVTMEGFVSLANQGKL